MSGKKRLKQSGLEKIRGTLEGDVLEAALGLTIDEIMEKTRLVDINRLKPRYQGGEYVDGNVEILTTEIHRDFHGNLRSRSEELQILKNAIDDREQAMKPMLRAQNQLDAYERRTDHCDPETVEHLQAIVDQCKPRVNLCSKRVKNILMELKDPRDVAMRDAALGVSGVGPITVAYCLAYIDIDGVFPDMEEGKPHPRAGQEKCRHASSLWKYVGLHCAAHERHQKGVKGGGNEKLRRQLFCMADNQMKQSGEPDKNGKVRKRGAYNYIYVNTKARLEASDELIGWTDATHTKRGGKHSRTTDNRMVEVAWREAKKSHRHGAALRQVMKHFTADWWFVQRTLWGLDTSPVYPVAKLGGSHRMIMPEERGWKFERKAVPMPKADEKAA